MNALDERDLELARRMVSLATPLGRWLLGERQALCDALRREPTPSEFVDYVLARLRADPKVRAMAVAAMREAEAAGE
ncbi:MAG: hypothetical protein JO312_26640 [Hyphomicrobiales bacterium]|nr:hypothetical protein [Hyphomicrobiales bacterium]